MVEPVDWTERLAGVRTSDQLAGALDVLRGGLSHRAIERAAARLAPGDGLAATLSHSTSGKMCLEGPRTLDTLKTFLAVCGVPSAQWAPWLSAWERSVGKGALRPPGAVKVKEADPRRLGVHRAIKVTGAVGELPEYVLRDMDDAEDGLRASLAEACEDGGFLVVVGASFAGKTRSLYEAVRSLVPDWWLLHPETADELDALEGEPLERVVIWLDDLHHFLGSASGLTGGTVRRLLQAGQVVVVGTLWPDRYLDYTGPPPDGARHSRDGRDLLAIAKIIPVEERFSEAELARAGETARRDPRLRDCLRISPFCPVQAIAAAPQLMARWHAANVYVRALVTAAIDAKLLGIRSPLPLALLRAATPAYCPGRARAEADPQWFDTALTYAERRLDAGMSLLAPVATSASGMGEVDGYEVTDYLLQQATADRTTASIPDALWRACLKLVNGFADLTRVGESAERCREFAYAEMFYRRAADHEQRAAYRLARLLAERGHDDEALEIVLPWAATPDTEASEFAVTLLERTGREEALRKRVGAGDGAAMSALVNLLVSMGREDELLADSAQNTIIACLLAELHAEKGDVDRAVEVLDVHVAAGDGQAADQLADLFIAADRLEDALEVLRVSARLGHSHAGTRLAQLLARLDRQDELRIRADMGDWPSAVHHAKLLADAGRLAELAERADSGDRPAGYRLAFVLFQNGREDELRRRADGADMPAVYYLAELLVTSGRHAAAIDVLKPYAEDGEEFAVSRLITLLGPEGGE